MRKVLETLAVFGGVKALAEGAGVLTFVVALAAAAIYLYLRESECHESERSSAPLRG